MLLIRKGGSENKGILSEDVCPQGTLGTDPLFDWKIAPFVLSDLSTLMLSDLKKKALVRSITIHPNIVGLALHQNVIIARIDFLYMTSTR